MTVMVEKKVRPLRDLPGIHPDIHHLPWHVLRDLGDGGTEGNLDVAGKVAQQVYENWNDIEWRNAFILALHSYIEDQISYHRGELQHLLDRSAHQAADSVRKAIVKSYLHTVLLETVEKAGRIHVRDYTRLGKPVSGYDREGGQGSAGTGRMTGGRGGYAERKANPESLGYGQGYEPNDIETQRVAGAQMAAQMYNAYANTLESSTEADKQAVEYTILRGDGRLETHRPKAGQLPTMGDQDVIIRAKPLGLQRPLTLGGSVFNAAQALGTPTEQAARSGAIAQNFKQAVSTETGDWGKRLIAASTILHHVTKGTNPHVSAAIEMGKAVGQHGPEVSKVLGGHVRRHMYRYRGVEADPTQISQVARDGRQKNNKGEPESIEAFQRKLTLNLARPVDDGGLQAIPHDEDAMLMLKSGGTPPSHGYLIDKKGEVKQQAHNYADDWYVPFNLKHLHDLNDGSYVRSRSYGGPTTEDISLAMRTGTQAFEVISRNGIFRVDFTQRTNKKGTKVGAWARDTANDANHVMVNRYGRLLDAVKSGKVDDPGTGQKLKLDGHGYAVALESLRKQFPYFIHKVTYIPAHGEAGQPGIPQLQGLRGDSTEDSGYIRPYYLRPEEAMAQYWDPKLGSGSFKSYDEDDRFRLGRARVLEARKKLAAQPGGGTGGVITPVPPARRGAPGEAPTTLGTQTQAVYNAGPGEFGPAQSEVAASKVRMNDEDFGDYLKWVGAVLDTADLTGHGHDIDEAKELHALLNPPDFESTAAFEAHDKELQKIQNDPDRRAEVESLLEQIAPQQGTGMELLRNRPVLRSLGEIPEEEENSEKAIVDRDEEEYNGYKKYLILKGQLEQKRAEKGPDATLNRPESMAHIKDWERIVSDPEKDYPNGMTMADIWEQTHEDYEGLPYWKHYENMKARVEGRKPPHPPNANPNPASSRTAVHEEDSDEERDRKAKEYEAETMRGLSDKDLSGWRTDGWDDEDDEFLHRDEPPF